MTDAYLVLHGLAIKKHADAGAVAAAVGLDEAEVLAALDEAVAERPRSTSRRGIFP